MAKTFDLQFLRTNDDMPNLICLTEFFCFFQLSFRERARGRCHGNTAISQRVVGNFQKIGGIDAAGKSDRDALLLLQVFFLFFCFILHNLTLFHRESLPL